MPSPACLTKGGKIRVQEVLSGELVSKFTAVSRLVDLACSLDGATLAVRDYKPVLQL